MNASVPGHLTSEILQGTQDLPCASAEAISWRNAAASSNSHERIRAAVQYKYLGYDRIPFGTDRRAQNAVYRNHGAKRGASTREFERAATAVAIPDGRDTVLSTFRPAAKCTKPGGETERGAHFGGPVGEFRHTSMSADFILLLFWTPSAHFGLNRMR